MDATEKKIQYGGIDIAKFLLSLLIVCAHYISENAIGKVSPVLDYGSSLYIIVVPFFFTCSGFFVFRKLDGKNDEDKVKDYCKKIFVMYAGWSIVYIGFQIATWFKYGTTRESALHYLLNAVTYSTYKTIWFLPATVIGVLMTYTLFIKVGTQKTYIIAVVCYIIGCLGASYSFILKNSLALSYMLERYNYIFYSSRNGFFNGFPFITLGLLIARTRKTKSTRNDCKYFILTLVFGMAFVMEAFIVKQKFHAVNVNTLLMLIPFTYFFVSYCLDFQMRTNRVTQYLRKMSTDIFLCQRLYLSALPTLIPESFFGKIITGNAYLGLLSLLFLTMVTSAGLVMLSNRSKWFRKFC